MAEGIEVEVAWREGEGVRVVPCRMAAGATVNDALRQAGAPAMAAVGIHGRICRLDQVLQGAERIEIYEALPNDPKRARRERARRGR